MQSYSSTITARTEVVPESSAMIYRPPIGTYDESTLLRSLSVTVIEGTFLHKAPHSVGAQIADLNCVTRGKTSRLTEDTYPTDGMTGRLMNGFLW